MSRYHWAKVVLLLCVCTLQACTGNSADDPDNVLTVRSGNGPPVITSATILNTPLSLDSPVAVEVHAEDPEREAVHFEYQWYADDKPLTGQTSPTLMPDQLRRGQLISVEVTPRDGQQKGQVHRTAAVPVGNTPPRVTAVVLVPSVARPGQMVEAQAEASDPDHDRTDLRFAWYRNGNLWREGEEKILDTVSFAAGDHIVVEVTARDEKAAGHPVRSAVLTLASREPQIVSAPPTTANGYHYQYPVKAVDPDGDRITYQLQAAPAGMSIDKHSGLIGWEIPPDHRGAVHVRVEANDGHGGVAFQEFDLHVAPPSSTHTASASAP
jgi:hypothetical protein